MVNVCFVDYLYPLMCGTWAIVDILRDAFSTNATSVGSVCLDAGDVNGVEVNLADSRVKGCIAFVGLESSASLARVEGFILGPSYNYSDAVFPFDSSRRHSGWTFLSAFSWGVWLAILGVVVAAVAVQLVMRVLKTDSSPVLTREDTAQIISRSVLASIGTSRLYDRSVTPRYILSCAVSIFAVGITCLYGSNLVNSFFKAYDTIPEITSIHPALKTQAQRWVSSPGVLPNGEFAGTPVVPRTIARYFNDTYALMTYDSKPVLYQVYTVKALAPDNVHDVLKNVQARLVSGEVDVRGMFEKGDALFKLTLADTWGLFVFILAGYFLSVGVRVLFTNKKGLCARYISNITPTVSVGFNTPVSGSPRNFPDLSALPDLSAHVCLQLSSPGVEV